MRDALVAVTPRPEGPNGTWDLRGRRLLSWRAWDGFGAGTYDRGDGEGVWRSDQHRLVFSVTPLPPMLAQLDGGASREVWPVPDAIGFYPAGLTVRTAGPSSRYAQVCWAPALYQAIAPHLPAPPQPAPGIAFQDPLLAQLALALADEIGQGMMDQLLADSLVAALAMRVAQRSLPRMPLAEPDLERRRLRRVLDHIEAHLHAPLTLAELAGIACLSPCHFSRSFKRAMGVGPQRYAVQRRVARAKEMLRRGEDTLAGIAASLGFADQSHFTAAFRRETDTTPGQYRAARQ